MSEAANCNFNYLNPVVDVIKITVEVMGDGYFSANFVYLFKTKEKVKFLELFGLLFPVSLSTTSDETNSFLFQNQSLQP